MTHTAEHVVVSFTTPIDSAKPNGWKAWHCLAIAFGLGFLAAVAVRALVA